MRKKKKTSSEVVCAGKGKKELATRVSFFYPSFLSGIDEEKEQKKTKRTSRGRKEGWRVTEEKGKRGKKKLQPSFLFITLQPLRPREGEKEK